MFRELLPADASGLVYRGRVEARLNQALGFRALEICKYTEHRKAGRTFYTADDDLSDMAIRRLNSIIKKFYKVGQSDRNLICSQIGVLLKENPPLNVVKIDLKSFYASVNESVIIDKIEKDRLLCPYTLSLLKAAICSNSNIHKSGLPEGICLSATLSELYLREIDRDISKTQGCVYYARFVDDILILTNRCPQEMLARASILLKDTAKINIGKNYTNPTGSQCIIDFNYLGYRFRRSGNNLQIEVSPKKICKLKTKIALSIVQHGQDRNYVDLYDRIRYLTSNSLITYHERSQPVKTGIFYTYSLLTEREAGVQMRKLDRFLRQMINAKRGKVADCLNNLSRRQRRDLVLSTFRSGFENRKMCRYQPRRILEIIKPWEYA